MKSIKPLKLKTLFCSRSTNFRHAM